MGDSQTSNIEHVTQDTAGVLNNYKLLNKQHIHDTGVFANKSVYFAGGGSGGEVILSHHASLNFAEPGGGSTKPFSISMWVYFLNPTLAAPTKQYLFRKGNFDDSTLREYAAYVYNSTLVFELHDESTDGTRKAVVDTALTVSDKRWQNIIFSSRGTGGSAADLSVSIDGVVVASTNLDFGSYTAMEDASSRAFIGSEDTECYIADVSLWNVDINDTDNAPAEIYNNGCPYNLVKTPLTYLATSNLLGWWKMANDPLDAIDGTGNSGASNILKDSAGGNDALPDSGFTDSSIIKLKGPCVEKEGFIPFSLGVPGVIFRRRRSAHQTNLD